MPSVAWTKEFSDLGRVVLVGRNILLLQLGPENKWTHEANIVVLGGEEGKTAIRCFALDGRSLWTMEECRLLTVLPDDRVLVTESDGALMIVDGHGHIVNRQSSSDRITYAAPEGDGLILSNERRVLLADFDLRFRREMLWPGKGSFYPTHLVGNTFYWVEGYELMSCEDNSGGVQSFCASFREAMLDAARCFEPQTEIDKDLLSFMQFKIFMRGLPPEMAWHLSSDSKRELLFLASASGPHFIICIDLRERRVRWCRVVSPGCCGGNVCCLSSDRYVTSTPCGGVLTWLDGEGNVLARAELNPDEEAYGALHPLAQGQFMVRGGPGVIGYGSNMERIWSLDTRFFSLAVHPETMIAAGFDFPNGSSQQPVTTRLSVVTGL